jgi:hypothetical protein
MNQSIDSQRERLSVMFSRIDIASPRQVSWYIRWLFRRLEPFSPEELKAHTPEDHIENIWGWNAPRQRAAKLLWQTLQGNDEPEYFDKYFRDDEATLINHAANSEAVLKPVQLNLKWVLDAFM